MSKITQAEHVIGKFARRPRDVGIRAAARALKKPPSTVQRWMQSGFIPSRHHDAVIAAAVSLGVTISPEDFFRDHTEYGSPSSASVVTDRPPLAAANHEEMFE